MEEWPGEGGEVKKTIWLMSWAVIYSTSNLFFDHTDAQSLAPVILLCTAFIVWAIEDLRR